jgi:hypothetical protein
LTTVDWEQKLMTTDNFNFPIVKFPFICSNIPVASYIPTNVTGGAGTVYPYGGGKQEYPEKTTDLLQDTDKTLSHNVVSSTPRHKQDSNSQL